MSVAGLVDRVSGQSSNSLIGAVVNVGPPGLTRGGPPVSS
jgi:hypothetical protein